MMNGTDAADQIVRYTLEGTEVVMKLTGSAAKNAAIFLLAVLKDAKKTHGHTTVRRMLREQKPLMFFHVPTDRLNDFRREARRYGLLYVAIKHRDSSQLTDIMVFKEDAPKLERIMDKLKLDVVKTGSMETENARDDIGNFFGKAPGSPSGNSLRYSSVLTQVYLGNGAERPGLSQPQAIPLGERETRALPPGRVIELGPAQLALPSAKPSVRRELRDIAAEQKKILSGKTIQRRWKIKIPKGKGR